MSQRVRASVHQDLEVRMKLFGIDAIDLLSTLFIASALSFILPASIISSILTILATTAFFLGSLWLRRRFQRGFLSKTIRYYLRPGSYRLNHPESENAGHIYYPKDLS